MGWGGAGQGGGWGQDGGWETGRETGDARGTGHGGWEREWALCVGGFCTSMEDGALRGGPHGRSVGRAVDKLCVTAPFATPQEAKNIEEFERNFRCVCACVCVSESTERERVCACACTCACWGRRRVCRVMGLRQSGGRFLRSGDTPSYAVGNHMPSPQPQTRTCLPSPRPHPRLLFPQDRLPSATSLASHECTPPTHTHTHTHACADRDDPTVKIPWVRPDLCGTKMLVMEWIDGIRCTAPDSIRSSGVRVDDFIKCGVVSGLRQLLEVGG